MAHIDRDGNEHMLCPREKKDIDTWFTGFRAVINGCIFNIIQFNQWPPSSKAKRAGWDFYQIELPNGQYATIHRSLPESITT